MIDFYIILVENDSAENAGAAARLVGNYDLKNLVFISPVWNNIERVKFIAHTEKGMNIITSSKKFSNLKDAITKLNLNLLLGFTRRTGKRREISANYKDYFKDFFENNKNRNTKIGLIFGREESGLNDAEIKECSTLLYIPTSNNSPSLNLSHSIAIVLNELFYYFERTYKRFSNLALDIENIFKTSTTSDRDLFYREILDLSKKKRLFIKNDYQTFRRMFERIFTTPIISKKDLKLFKRLLERYIYADKKE